MGILKTSRKVTAEEKEYQLENLKRLKSDFEMELTWLRDRKEPYNLGDEEFHLAFRTDDFDSAYEIYDVDFVYAGGEAYAGMRRATNGGGENSPMLENEDDNYSLFMAAIHKKTTNQHKTGV